MPKIFKAVALLSVLSLLSGCATMEPMKTVDKINLEKFMGDWYVIANIPTFLERNAHNALESYSLHKSGRIDTTFTFRKGGFDGPLKTYRPKGFIKDKQNNALWGMQFVWPIKADYRIVYLNDDYSQVIVGRRARDYVWIMSRAPQITDEDYRLLSNRVLDLGYDITKLVKVPQRWPESGR